MTPGTRTGEQENVHNTALRDALCTIRTPSCPTFREDTGPSKEDHLCSPMGPAGVPKRSPSTYLTPTDLPNAPWVPSAMVLQFHSQTGPSTLLAVSSRELPWVVKALLATCGVHRCTQGRMHSWSVSEVFLERFSHQVLPKSLPKPLSVGRVIEVVEVCLKLSRNAPVLHNSAT